MKVVLVNHSDTLGGASVVSLRLLNALRDQGVDARMIVAKKNSDSPYVAEVGHKLALKCSFLKECAEIWVNNGLSKKRIFDVSTGHFGVGIANHPWILQAHAVLLNWVNQGMLSLCEISRIKAPVAWTMHDMWNLTGICHHAHLCARYEASCGCCPYLGRMASENDLSHRVWADKKSLYSNKDITFVGVSNWVAGLAKRSSLLSGQRVEVIPNAFPIEEFRLDAIRSRKDLGLPEGKKLIVMGAARLDHPVKGLPLAIDALNTVSSRRDDVAAVFYGSVRDASVFERLRMPHVLLGTIADGSVLADVMAHSSIVLSASSYETLPGTLIEGMACGCVPVTFGQGGQGDIVDHLDTGYIAQYPDYNDLANGLSWALEANIPEERLRTKMEEKFGAAAIARQYISLFESLKKDKR